MSGFANRKEMVDALPDLNAKPKMTPDELADKITPLLPLRMSTWHRLGCADGRPLWEKRTAAEQRAISLYLVRAANAYPLIEEFIAALEEITHDLVPFDKIPESIHELIKRAKDATK